MAPHGGGSRLRRWGRYRPAARGRPCRRGGWWLALALALVAALAGCGGPPEPAPAELAAGAAAAVDQLTSVHFLLTIEGGPAFLDQARMLNLRQAEGDLLRPDRSQATARVALGGLVVTVKFINIGATGYMTDPLSGRWGPAPPGLGYNAGYLFDKEQGVGAILRQIEGIGKAGEESIEGVASHHLTGELPAARLQVLTGGVIPGERVKVDVWAAKEGLSLRQIRLTEIGAAKTPMTWTLVLSRHDQPVAIEPPQ